MSTFVLDPAAHTVAQVTRPSRPHQRKQYRDKQFAGGEEEWKTKIEASTTVYVGNLSCYTNEYQLYELFGRCGSVKRIVMGLDKNKKVPCGFCFVEFAGRESALKSIRFLNRSSLDGRDIHVDIDAGFIEGRQYGRGKLGGQVADEKHRERNSTGSTHNSRRCPMSGTSPVLTRSITIVACIAIIAMLLVAKYPEPVQSDIIFRPYSRNTYANSVLLRQSQFKEIRSQFETTFAQFLVGVMKTAKPTLMKAFIQATLADKQLKEIAIAAFFNNTETDDDTS